MSNHKRFVFVSWNLLFLVQIVLISVASGDNESIAGNNKESKSLVVCKLDAGPLGLPGSAGIEGKSGAKGDKGNPGIPGLQGLAGIEGKSGPKGDKGDPGIPGLQGLAGIEGKSGPKGDKGDSGIPGLQGLAGIEGKSGPKGDKGDPGIPGLQGLAGIEGKSGPMGDKGDPGLPGLQGLAGIEGKSGAKGDKGDPGLSGLPGSAGIEGKSGVKGDKGDPGQPGPPGKCAACRGGGGVPSGSKNLGSNEIYGTEDDPASLLCKDETASLRKEWWVGPKSDPLQVNCKETDSTTCVNGLKPKTVIFGDGDTKPFWLSQRGLKINELTGLSMVQLQWLQERSSSVYQTIKYHCLNTRPFYRDNLEKSILLLTWDGMVIGPEPSLTSPLSYTVPDDTDNCSRAKKDEWSHTEIIIKTNFVQRLPVADFLIRNVKNETQQVQIEIVEICF